MKAFLLAAGLGTRLRPLTNKTPKCLVNICGQPLLNWWIRLFEKHSIDEVLINLHHLPEQVIKFIESSKTNVKFNFFYEETLLGSGGTLRENKNFVKDENHFLICYADNLTNYNLNFFLDFHKTKSADFSMALFRTNTPQSKGIVVLDNQKKIIEFEEKPQKPKSNLANAGMYISTPEILDMIPQKEITDIGFDLLPKLVGRSYGWESKNYLLDIGTPADLSKAEEEWKEIIKGEVNDL